MTSHGGARRAAYIDACRTCHATVWTGLDADIAAFTATADNTPLTHQGALLAVIAGRTTYTLDPRNALDRRDRWQLNTPTRNRVLPEHRCHQPVPRHWRAPRPAAATPTTEVSF